MNWWPWWAVWRHVITAAFITVMSAVQRVAVADSCPESYWDEPSKRCSRPLIAVLDQLRPADTSLNWSLTDQAAINRTCLAWQKTNSCFTHLSNSCQANPKAVQEIEMRLHRYSTYALACNSQSLRQQRRLFDCFLPEAGSTSTCTEAFDKYFRSYVIDKQYRNACRVVSSAMKCFREVQDEMISNPPCEEEGKSAYQRLYIQPLVELTRDVVTAHCDKSPIYDHYLTTSTATPCERLQTRTSSIISCAFALLFARWRYWSR